jgi:N-methylhydantoinase B/oxoprolinase/acetone carboxylase alpha subunit
MHLFHTGLYRRDLIIILYQHIEKCVSHTCDDIYGLLAALASNYDTQEQVSQLVDKIQDSDIKQKWQSIIDTTIGYI